MTDGSVNDLEQELFSELTGPLVQPLLVRVVPPVEHRNDLNFSLQINGNVLWEWRKLEGNLKKLFTVLQVNLQANGYSLKQSAFNRVSHQLNTRTRNFLKQMKTERNGKRRARKKAETWIKISLYAHKILKTPYDIVAEMKATEDELRKANDQLQTTVERQAASLCEQLVEEWTNGNKGRYLCDPDHWQQRRHLSKIQEVHNNDFYAFYFARQINQLLFIVKARSIFKLRIKL